MAEPEVCQETVYWGSRDVRGAKCGRPVKRDGMCGRHAAGADRRKAAEERRNREWDERTHKWAHERQVEEHVLRLGGEWPVTPDAYLALLIEIEELRSGKVHL